MSGNDRRIRWIDLSNAQKKEVLRIRNMEQCRKNRQKWKEEDIEMEDLYQKNERKIEELENLVNKLSKELGIHPKGPRGQRGPSGSKGTKSSKGASSSK